ncbi:TIGR04222 domain-containing membrane protein [Bremerella sp.]|uniref:TIGR04222 domain-containing membrane protein n=1 Tax=Bremerella sp. TaxID=2795602 RepID=UPI00391D06CF
MDAEAKALWSKIEAFSFDEPGTTLTFAARLARENGWRLGFAQRVIDEYRRFLFLSMVAGHAVSPSEAVDQAWHLHLTYTKSYWEKLCGEILPRPLHHCPTRGRKEESEKFDDWYTKTLASYEEYFGDPPTSDIWPSVGEQMESVVDSRWVNQAEYFIIPRNPLKWLALILLVLLPLVSLGGCQADPLATVSPLDFDGPTFLKFYAIAGGVFLVIALGIRFLMPIPEPPIPAEVNDPTLAAYLAQGPKGLVIATIAKLIQDRNVELVEGKYSGGRVEKQLMAVKPLARGASTLESHIFDEIKNSGTNNTQKVIANSVPIAKEAGAKLTEMGLFEPNPYEPAVRRWVPSLIMLGVFGFGCAKLAIGITRDKPVLYLALLVIPALISSIWLAIRRGRTAQGEAILSDWQHEHSHLNPMAPGSSINTADDYFLAAGLFGITAFSSGDLYPLSEEFRAAQGSSWGGFGGGCGGDSGCGGGGSCGSGCGGGGCGGCGGD